MSLIHNAAHDLYYKNNVNKSVPYRFLKNRGINDLSIEKFKLGYSFEPFKLYDTLKKLYSWEDIKDSNLFNIKENEKGAIYFDRFVTFITIPLLQNNNIVSYTSRRVNNEYPKHLHLSGGFNLPYNSNTICKHNILLIVESPLDAIILEQEGFSAISVFGANGINKEQISYINNFKGKIVWLFDNEKKMIITKGIKKSFNPGQEGALKSALFLWKELQKESFIGILPYYDEALQKVDITSLFLYNKETFYNTIKQVIENSIPYKTTFHFQRYEEKVKKKQEKVYEKELLMDQIKNYPLIKLLKDYINIEETGFGGQALCPFHEETKGSFTIYNNTNHYICFGCGQKGDFIEFIRKYYDVDFKRAIEKIKENYRHLFV